MILRINFILMLLVLWGTPFAWGATRERSQRRPAAEPNYLTLEGLPKPVHVVEAYLTWAQVLASRFRSEINKPHLGADGKQTLITQAQLARLIGVSPSTITNLSRGAMVYPSMIQAKKIADKFQVPLAYLVAVDYLDFALDKTVWNSHSLFLEERPLFTEILERRIGGRPKTNSSYHHITIAPFENPYNLASIAPPASIYVLYKTWIRLVADRIIAQKKTLPPMVNRANGKDARNPYLASNLGVTDSLIRWILLGKDPLGSLEMGINLAKLLDADADLLMGVDYIQAYIPKMEPNSTITLIMYLPSFREIVEYALGESFTVRGLSRKPPACGVF